MKTFFSTIGRSVYGPEMYQELLGKPFSFSLKHYIKFALLVSFIITVVIAVKAMPLFGAALGNFSDKLVEFYPADLVIEIKNGQVLTNKPEPYFIPLPSGEKYEKNGATFNNLVLVYTKQPFALTTFQNYHAVAWVMKDSVAIFKNANNTAQIIPLKGVPDMTFNQEYIRSLGSKINPIAKILPFIIVPFIFIAGLFYFAFQMIYLLIGSLLVWLLLTITKRKVGYGKAYQIGLHAMTLGILISALNILLGIDLKIIPLQFTILLLIMVGINFAGAQKPVVTEISSTPKTTV